MGGAVFPPCYLLGRNYGGGNGDNGDLLQKDPMHGLLLSVPPTLQQATTDPHLHWRLMDAPRQVWVSLLWGHCSFLLGPGAHKVLSVPSKSMHVHILFSHTLPFIIVVICQPLHVHVFRILDLHYNPCHPHGPFQWPCGQSNQPEGFFNLSVLAPSFSSQSIMTLIVILSSPSS